MVANWQWLIGIWFYSPFCIVVVYFSLKVVSNMMILINSLVVVMKAWLRKEAMEVRWWYL